MLEQIEAGDHIHNLKMNVLQAIQYIIQGWDEITAETIHNCWQHTQILSNGDDFLDDINETDNNSILDELDEIIETLHFPNAMQAKEFLTISEEDIIYEIPEDDDQIIAEIASHYKKNDEIIDNSNDLNDDSIEILAVNPNTALKNLEMVSLFLLKQEDANEYLKYIGKIEKFIRKSKINLMEQTTIDQYFN